MIEIPHTHDESAPSPNTHAHSRWTGKLQSRNFRLARTSGTDTKFTLYDRRTAAEVEFDHCRVGIELGRGDTVQFYVGDVDHSKKHPDHGMDQVGSYYQHDLDDEILGALGYVEVEGELPSPDTVLDAEGVQRLREDDND